ncbi:MAG: SIR2 family NAD-dependent protein deacylase [Candidatus Heimdallarchaeaceae archaeon]
MNSQENIIEEIANVLIRAEKILFFTGAGISTASGIPDFRSPGGIWSKYEITEYGTLDAFKRDPTKIWEFFRELYSSFSHAEPNTAHYALAQIQSMLGEDKVFIATQNIDRLHQLAGSTNVFTIHGSVEKMHCIWCFYEEDLDEKKHFQLLPYPICPKCNNPLKAKIILFGEYLPKEEFESAMKIASECDVVFGIGTSLEVYPASEVFLQNSSATRILVNLEPTRYNSVLDYFIQGNVIDALPSLVENIKKLVSNQE